MPEQVWHPYTMWEDWQAGLWRAVPVDPYRDTAARILANPDTFYAAAKEMLADWTNAAEHNLTNTDQNRRAWVGQATCCHLANVPESATRFAWWVMMPTERDAANAVADRIIAEWESEREATRRPTLFALEEFRDA
jgi:hypothetical protein